jgi:hypothetical protein
MLVIKKPEYVYLKITSHTSIRNYNSSNLARAIHNMGSSLIKRIEFEERKLIYKAPLKCCYCIDIKKDKVQFIFVVPKQYEAIAKQKINETWPTAVIDNIKCMEKFSDNAIKYELKYKYEDALSLDVDKRSSEPLSSILSVLEVMSDNDRVALMYNFIPTNQNGWDYGYKQSMEKLEHGFSLEKDISFHKVIKLALNGIAFILESFIGGVLELVEGKKAADNTVKNIKHILGIAENGKNLSESTKKKRSETVIRAQMVVLAEGDNCNTNAISVCQSFKNNDEGIIKNELLFSKIKKIFSLENYDWGISSNRMSLSECHNLLQLPGREVLSQFQAIKRNDTLEIRPPNELIKGYISLGECTYKTEKVKTYMSDDKNLANLGLVLLGPQGSGKSEFIANYSKAATSTGEGLILIDFIKNCELSDKVKSVVNKDRLIEIDLSNYDQAQSFGFNEINNIECKTDLERLELANMQTQLTLSFINAINPDDELSSRMRRSLSSACNIVFIHKGTSLRDVVNCCQDHRKRQSFIERIPASLVNDLQDDINNLMDMNELGKSKEDKGQIIGTKDTKTEFIMDRINLLMEDIKLKRMFNKPIDNNLDFVQLMNKGKIILIKIPESKFPTKFHKNILTTFYISKIWLASQLRGSLYNNPLRCHAIVDEIFQAPTSEKMLVDILPQGRKFSLKFIFSAHYLSQIQTIKEALKASGASYMLLQGTDKKNYDEMKEDLMPFELEDLLNLKRFNSLNMIKYSKGYAKFITQLPPLVEMKR